MLTTIPSNNPNRRNRLNFKWLCGNSPRFVSLLGLICVNTGGHSSPPSRPAGDGEKTSPVGRLSMPRGRFSMPMSRARGRLRHGGGRRPIRWRGPSTNRRRRPMAASIERGGGGGGVGGGAGGEGGGGRVGSSGGGVCGKKK